MSATAVVYKVSAVRMRSKSPPLSLYEIPRPMFSAVQQLFVWRGVKRRQEKSGDSHTCANKQINNKRERQREKRRERGNCSDTL